MEVIVHALIFAVAGVILWYLAGSLVNTVDRIAHRSNQSGFWIAFLVLGLLTSISEISVATNASLAGVPSVSIGNLIGASFVILFLVLPAFAIAGNGVELRHAISRKNFLITLAVSLLPAVLVIDGVVTRAEGVLSILAYATVVYFLHRQKTTMALDPLPASQKVKGAMMKDIGRVLLGAAGIFIAAHFLVQESVYFAELLTVPASLIGLIVLSIGTNIPELVIAIRSVTEKHKDIAFGDYLGSVAMNVPIFGAVALFAGPFFLEASEFYVTTALMVIGTVVLWVFARSQRTISRKEGIILLLFYLIFVVIQFANLIRFATT